MSDLTARPVAVLTDSTADIPPERARELDISVVPALLTLDGETYRDDGKDITRHDFYQRLGHLRHPPTTAAPSIAAFEDAYQQLLKRGFQSVLSIHLPRTLSAMIDVAAQAAKAFAGKVHVFDSGQVSLGTGFQVMEAARLALRGASLDAVLQAARRTRERVRLIAMIDTLEFLHRSGRIGWLSANLGAWLQVRILLEVLNGAVKRLGSVRTRGKAIAQLEAMARSWGKLQTLAVAHSANAQGAHQLAQRLGDLAPTPPLIVEVTTVIGAHIGPGALGIIGVREN
jgi:DegV family protein with EDD domain